MRNTDACRLIVKRIELLLISAIDIAIKVPEEPFFLANFIWQTLTPGKRRSFAFRVSSAKRAETRLRRIDEVLDAILNSRKTRRFR